MPDLRRAPASLAVAEWGTAVKLSEMLDRRMRMLGPERYAAWRAKEDERLNRWRTCRHRYGDVRHAGILGWRVFCGPCGHMFSPFEHLGCLTCEEHPKHHYWNDGEGDPLLRLDQELRVFAERNRAPGHPLRPVTNFRHIVYRPKPTLVTRHGRMLIDPSITFEVYRGSHLLGTVSRTPQGQWLAWTAEKAPGMGAFDRRSHAARSLLARLNAGYLCHRFGGLCPLLPNPLWDESKQRLGPHYCNIARLGGEHHCMCVCGVYLDLDARRNA